MNDVFFRELGIRPPDHSLGVGSGSHADQTGRVMTEFEPLLAELDPDVVVVVGDVNSTVACALVAAKQGMPRGPCRGGPAQPRLGHAGGGQPGRHRPPERLPVRAVATTPWTTCARRATATTRSHLVGNVMVDTLLANLDRARESDTLERLRLAPGGYGVITLHRPANVDDPETLRRLLSALNTVAETCPLVFPVHPRTAASLAGIRLHDDLRLLPPAGYLDFLALQAGARLVLTDSGGIQEETTVLGVPCLTLRDNTERPITVTEGTNRVVGRDPETIVEAALAVLAEPPTARRPALWDGRAGERIAAALVDGGRASTRLRPTDQAVDRVSL